MTSVNIITNNILVVLSETNIKAIIKLETRII